MYHRFFGFRILTAVLVVGILFAVGSSLYRLGYTQGWAQSAIVQAASLSGGQGPSLAPGYAPGYAPGFAPGYAPGYPYSPGFFGPRFGFFPFFGFCLFGLFVLFLFGFLLRGPRRWGRGHGHPHPWGTPPWDQGRGQAEQEPATPEEEDRPV